MNLSALKIKNMRRKLLIWFARQQREMPWRKTKDPYSIWVSEIMLQQTQVITVIPYYLKFIERFPDVKSLAEAEESEVLAYWSGLGYYRRAKLLHHGAQKVWRDFGGKLPDSVDLLRQIPGIGAYTAGAIASIAFERAVPLVDGNVVRVLSRLFMLPGHAKEVSLHRKIWELCADLVDPKFPGDFNQALMELGATLCRVENPLCLLCPLQKECLAVEKANPEAFPGQAPKPEVQVLHRAVAIAIQDQKILLVKNKESRWFQGMWQLPHIYLDSQTAQKKNELALKPLQNFLQKSLSLQMQEVEVTPMIKHQITQHKIFSLGFWGKAQGTAKNSKGFESFGFFTAQEIQKLAFSNFDRKILKAAQLMHESDVA